MAHVAAVERTTARPRLLFERKSRASGLARGASVRPPHHFAAGVRVRYGRDGVATWSASPRCRKWSCPQRRKAIAVGPPTASYPKSISISLSLSVSSTWCSLLARRSIQAGGALWARTLRRTMGRRVSRRRSPASTIFRKGPGEHLCSFDVCLKQRQSEGPIDPPCDLAAPSSIDLARSHACVCALQQREYIYVATQH